MNKQQIIDAIEAMEYYYNDESKESIAFWKEAVKKVPEFLKQDIADLRQSVKETCSYDPELPTDFEFSKVFGEILKPLGLDIVIESL